MQIVGLVVLVLLVLSVPIGIALSAAAAAYIMVDPLLEPTVIFRAFFSFIGKYSLMAIPLFIFAGFLMEKTGLVGQLFRFADSLVGWLPGGFGVATVLACVLFGAISGSSVAMAAAMSVIAIPEMRKRPAGLLQRGRLRPPLLRASGIRRRSACSTPRTGRTGCSP